MTQPEILKGWQQISEFLGKPVSVVQRWSNEDMPVRKQGRFVTTTAGELDAWLGKESGKPVHVATEITDLTAELKRGLSYVRNQGHAETMASPALGRGDAKIAPSLRKPGKRTGNVAKPQRWRAVVLSRAVGAETLPLIACGRCPRWYKPGLLLIGDAAHVMSPVGGVGINYAVQDATVASKCWHHR